MEYQVYVLILEVLSYVICFTSSKILTEFNVEFKALLESCNLKQIIFTDKLKNQWRLLTRNFFIRQLYSYRIFLKLGFSIFNLIFETE